MASAPTDGVAPRSERIVHDPTDAGEERLLAYASVVGREFDFGLLTDAMGADAEGLAELAERLVAKGVLRERPEGGRFAFVHEDYRAQVYQSLTESRLRVLHRKIGESIERLTPLPPPEILPELGRHYFLGKIHAKSFEFNRQAATLARQADAPEVAAHHLERARLDIHALPERLGTYEVEVEEELGDLYASMGDLKSADAHFQQALGRIPATDPARRAQLTLSRAELAREGLEIPRADALAREAEQLFRAAQDDSGLGRVHRTLGRLAYHRGDARQAVTEFTTAQSLLTHTADRGALGRCWTDLGDAYAALGLDARSEARRAYDRAIDLLTGTAEWPELARAELSLGRFLGVEEPTEALAWLNESCEHAERSHEPRVTVASHLALAEFRLGLGELDQAERESEQARRILERMRDPFATQRSMAIVGLIAERRGRWEESEGAYRESNRISAELGLASELAEGEFRLARLLYKIRDYRGAEIAMSRASEHGILSLHPGFAESFRELARKIVSRRAEAA